MLLDTDGDGKISLDEWRRGWEKGTVGSGAGLAPAAAGVPDWNDESAYMPVTPGKG